MIQLTNDRAAELARRCNERLKAKGQTVNKQSEIYVRLNDYERLGKSPAEIETIIKQYSGCCSQMKVVK